MWRWPSNVRCSYTSSQTAKTSCARASSAMNARSEAAKDLAGRVHRRIQQQRLGAWPERGGKPIPRQLPVRREQAHHTRHGPKHPDHRQVCVIRRLDHHDLVAGLEDRHEAGGDRLRGARGDDDLAERIDPEPVEPVTMRRDRAAELRQARHRRILVASVRQRLGCGADDVCRTVGVGKTLAEIDAVVLQREPRHHGEHRGADPTQQGVDAFHPSVSGRSRCRVMDAASFSCNRTEGFLPRNNASGDLGRTRVKRGARQRAASLRIAGMARRVQTSVAAVGRVAKGQSVNVEDARSVRA